jgi:membrane protease YdiL (CAAX protease family)
LVDYGINIRDLKDQVEIALACFIPVTLSYLPLRMGFNETTWSGAIVMAALNIGLLLFLALFLRKKIPVAALGTAAAWMLLWPSGSANFQTTLGKAIALFLTYALFVGFGEEILFRGYIQSQLNEAFGRPYRFFETPFGWGGLITAPLT